MNFRTVMPINKSHLDISYLDKILFLGSCFSENINEKLVERKFDSRSNPFGITYNPISIFNIIDFVLEEKNYTKEDLFLQNEIWNCYDFHSDMSGLEVENVLRNINEKIIETKTFLKETNVLFITLGTAWVYENNNKIVANCHKVPSSQFEKRLLTFEEIETKAKSTFAKLKQFNENIKIVFTLSPVRHLKDGFVENNLSKSILLVAINNLQKEKNISYFPAYELVIDDLRDYRFYKEDLVHPNYLAINYIFEQFKSVFFTEKTLTLLVKVEKLLKAFQHRINYKETQEYIKFRKNLEKQVADLSAVEIDFSKELSNY